jgi:hypothetical protein
MAAQHRMELTAASQLFFDSLAANFASLLSGGGSSSFSFAIPTLFEGEGRRTRRLKM